MATHDLAQAHALRQLLGDEAPPYCPKVHRGLDREAAGDVHPPKGARTIEGRAATIMLALRCSESKARHLLSGRCRLYYDDAARIAAYLANEAATGQTWARRTVRRIAADRAAAAKERPGLQDAGAFLSSLGAAMAEYKWAAMSARHKYPAAKGGAR